MSRDVPQQQPLEIDIPILTDAIVAAGPALPPGARDALVAELATQLAARAFRLTEDLLRSALADFEAKLLAEVTARLRRELPEIVDATLHEYLSLEDR